MKKDSSEPLKSLSKIEKNRKSTVWQFLFSHFIQSMGGKTGGQDQESRVALTIDMSAIHLRPINYAAVIFDDLELKLNKRQREKVVPYTRFLSMVFSKIFDEKYSKEANILHDDETPTTGPEIASLEAYQQTGSYPLEGTMERTSINPSDNAEEPSSPFTEPAMGEEYDMAEDVKLLLPAVETIFIKMDEVHKGMPQKDEVAADLLAVRAKPILAPEPSFTAGDRAQLDDTREAAVLLACAMTRVEEMMALQIQTVDHFFVTDAEAEAPRVKAEVDVADENPTSCEAPVVEDVDVVRPNTEARDNNLPINFVVNAGDMEDDDEEDDEVDIESSDLPDAGKDLDDDDDDDDEEDDDDDDFTI
ncbi:ribosomal L1 domain-containing protein CG13096-like [Cynara cardunculus var. scolymus]|uniref:ribosomal L1 domain-containing protein CG13096-like n=1 Tax=Cynara cardunculus var. scolymus TaxID=59895 RepID=UPI000D626291|nr:ribosomal L1 domain-containing protein CG13096-like [Cynara cardunculus var. scolymus]